MRILELELQHFRNYSGQRVSFDPDCNVIFGENAQGKTNLLEAIVYLSCGKSPRARTDREMIAFDAPAAVLEAGISARDREFRTRVELYRDRRRKMWVNQVPAKNSAALSQVYHTVFFCPDDLYLIREGAAARRRFMDTALCQLRPRYAAALAEYHRLYDHKTRILRDSEERPDLLELLPDFNERMVRFGAVLVHYRRQFAEALKRYAARHHRECSGGRERLEITYQTVSSVTDPAAEVEVLTEQLRAHMESHQGAERASRMCLSGPHKDDLVITICFSRYTAQIAEGAAFLHAHDVPIVLMTDLEPSPLYAYAACTLQCEASAEGYFPCYAGCLSILYALCSTLGSMRGTDAAEHARELERVLLDRGVFL